MSNKFLIKSILISVFTIIKSFEIEIINPGGLNNNPFEIFGPPNNIMNEIINDIEKDMVKSLDKKEKANIFTPFGKKPNKSKLPHRHKEIIEVNGPGFKSVEIREVITPEDSNKGKKTADSLFNHKRENNNNVENMIEKAMDQFEKEILNEPRQNPFDNMINNLFAPSIDSPIIFVKEKRNLKHDGDNIKDASKALSREDHVGSKSHELSEMQEFNPINIFSGLDQLVKGFINLGDSLENAEKKENKNTNNNMHDINKINLSLNTSHAEDPIHISTHADHKNFNASKPVTNNHPNNSPKKVPNKNGQKSTPQHNKHPTNHPTTTTHNPKQTTAQKVIPTSPITQDINHNTTTIVNTQTSSYFESIFGHNSSITNYIFYSLIGIFTLVCAVFILYQIIQRDSELSKQNKNHSINQIEDELKRMKDHNKLY